MKRFITILAVLALVAVPVSALAQSPYAWTLSSSLTSDNVNTGPFVPGLLTLYLWLRCSDLADPLQDGMSAADFGLRPLNPANVVLSFTPMNGFLNAGTATDLLLAVGQCPGGPLVSGSVLVLANAPDQYTMAVSITGVKGTVDCSANPQIWPIDWVGYADDGNPAPGKGTADCVPTTSVEQSSWGQVKGLYR